MMIIRRRWQVVLMLTALLISACTPPGSSPAGAPTAVPTAELPTIPPTTIPTAVPTPTVGATPDARQPIVQEYDLGTAIVEQTQANPTRTNLPYQIQGLIAVPPGSGKHPLIVVTHGSHPGCPENPAAIDLPIDTWPCPPEQEQRNDLGWRYLLESLARQGFIAVSLNMNAVHTAAWGTTGSTYERYAAILDTHLSRINAANTGTETRFGIDLQQRIDWSRMALIGHSQGGGYALLYASEYTASPNRIPGSSITSLLLVAPALQSLPSVNPSLPEALPVPDLPIGIVMGLCDGDVSSLDGFVYNELARKQAERASIMQIALLYGANHSFFNTILNADNEPAGAIGCDRPGQLTAPQQRAFLDAFAGDFFANTLVGQPISANWQADSTTSQQLYGVPVQTTLLLSTAQRRALLDLTADSVIPTDASAAGLSAVTPLTATLCSIPGNACSLTNTGIPAADRREQPVVHVQWEQPGGALLIRLPSEARDISAFGALQMRIVPDAFEPANTGGQPLRIELRDILGGTAVVDIPAETFALQPPPAEVRDADTPQPYLRGVVPLTDIRIPLAAFSGVDLTQIESVQFLFDQRDQGALLIADLELLR